MSTSSTISTSAQSATFLVLLQISSRGFTFVVNQILLRYLSPKLLGISQQLELFAISVLYFSRESLRVALQRQSVESKSLADKSTKDANATPPSQRLQELVNLSYLPVLLGPILATLFAWLYLAKASAETLSVEYLRISLQLFCVAAVIELTAEPCFAFAAQKQNIRLRAGAETIATISRCVVTVASAVWASRSRTDLGALPFAFGQCAYAIGLWTVYYSYVLKTKDDKVSMLPKKLQSNSNHVLAMFPQEILALASSLYAQSGLKHILTQGDALLITLFTDLSHQGIFALASNYGSLLARILFQPIEESSRGLFGRSLSNTLTSDSSSKKQARPTKDELNTVHTYLITLLRFYSHLALLLLVIAPPLSKPLLSILAGKTWGSSAARILAKYCYYLPLLAYNGLLEAFVSATASPAELQKQSIAMLAFSAIFAAAGYVLLGVLDRGVDGIIEANMCNMTVRIAWSKTWVERWWHDTRIQKGAEASNIPMLQIFSASTLPHPVTLAIAVSTWAFMRQSLVDLTDKVKILSGLTNKGSLIDTAIDIAVVVLISLPMLSSIAWYEWNTFLGPAIQRISSFLSMKLGITRLDTEKKTI